MSFSWKSALGGGDGEGEMELGLRGSWDLWGLGGREMMEVFLEERDGNEMYFLGG